jgi:hypothetical protein
VIDLIGPIIQRAVESRDCRSAVIHAHYGNLPAKRKYSFGRFAEVFPVRPRIHGSILSVDTSSAITTVCAK